MAQHKRNFCAAFFKKRLLSSSVAVSRMAAAMILVTAMAMIAAMVIITVMPPDTARQADREKSKRQRRGKNVFHQTDMAIPRRSFNVGAQVAT